MKLRIAMLACLASLCATTAASAAAPDGAGPWADTVVNAQQGKRMDGTPVLPARSIPSNALGVAENSNTTGFYSLGIGGSMTLGYTNPICNRTGADLDLDLHEATAEPYTPELVDVYVSADGTNFVLAKSNVNKDAQIALPTSVPVAHYVRLVDKTATDNVPDPANADGYDVDGVAALDTNCAPPVITCRASNLRVDVLSALGLPLFVLEPNIANNPNNPCASEDKTLLPANLPAGTTATTIHATTALDPEPGTRARAFTEVEKLMSTGVPGGLSADAITSTAEAKCVGGALTFSGSSNIANGSVAGNPVSGNASSMVDLGGGLTLYINRTIVLPNDAGLIQRGIEVDANGKEVLIVGEAKVGQAFDANTLGSAC